MLEKLFDWLFRCTHTTFPQGRHPHAHVTCLDCGREFAYDVRTWTRESAQPTNVQRPTIPAGAKEI
jgi:Fe2+ or Zn2+ uptake regulation protein